MGRRRRLQRGGIILAASICGITRLIAQGAGASVAGLVVDEATGAPVRKAGVELLRVGEGGMSAQDVTDAQGRFGFSNLPPGKYRLRGEKDGYAPKMLGAKHLGQPGVILTLAEGDARWDLQLAITPFGAITGRVHDGDGDPLEFAQVEILQRGWRRGKLEWQSRGTSGTDERGEYRVQDVPAGEYFVMANELQRRRSGEQYSIYGVQIYPGADRISQATPVEVKAGRETGGIDFRLVLRPAVALKGRVQAPPDVPENVPVQVELIPRDEFRGGWGSLRGAALGKDRAFQLQATDPGPYRLVASVTSGGVEWRGVTDVELAEGGEEVNVPLYRGVNLSGRVTVEGPGAERYKRFNVTISPGDGLHTLSGPPRAATDGNGDFTLKNVVMGIWDLRVAPIPKGGYLKSMKLGDRDVSTEDMTIAPDTSAPLKIVVSTQGATVTGDVESAGLATGKQAVAFLAPEGKFSRVLGFYRRVLADDKGHFEMRGIHPGAYRVFAFEELGENDWQNPDFLKSFAARGEAVTLEEGRTAEVKLKPIRVGEGGSVER